MASLNLTLGGGMSRPGDRQSEVAGLMARELDPLYDKTSSCYPRMRPLTAGLWPANFHSACPFKLTCCVIQVQSNVRCDNGRIQ